MEAEPAGLFCPGGSLIGCVVHTSKRALSLSVQLCDLSARSGSYGFCPCSNRSSVGSLWACVGRSSGLFCCSDILPSTALAVSDGLMHDVKEHAAWRN